MSTKLAASIDTARRGSGIQKCSMQQVIVDTTVMPKTTPTDNRLLGKSPQHLVKGEGIFNPWLSQCHSNSNNAWRNTRRN